MYSLCWVLKRTHILEHISVDVASKFKKLLILKVLPRVLFSGLCFFLHKIRILHLNQHNIRVKEITYLLHMLVLAIIIESIVTNTT